MTGRLAARLATALAAAAATSAAVRMLDAAPPGGRQRWLRSNYRGRQVDLLAGPATAAGALATAAVLAGGGATGALVAAGPAAALGLYDDLAGSTHARGLLGHARALRRGELTTGAVKMAGLVVAGLIAAALPPGRRRGADLVIDAALVSGLANLVNLLDLRPGRALKAALAVAVPLTGSRRDRAAVAAAGVAGTVCVLLPGDLGERRMLGDGGANPLGALLGWAVAAEAPRAVRVPALLAVVGLTLASERVSFSAVIDRSPVLRAVDGWGRPT